VYWHPVGAEDADLLVTPDIFLSESAAAVRRAFDEGEHAHKLARIFNCAEHLHASEEPGPILSSFATIVSRLCSFWIAHIPHSLFLLLRKPAPSPLRTLTLREIVT
jgi:hypothetical protein